MELDPDTLLSAYCQGVFPMPHGDGIGWFSPDPRGILPPERLVVSRSLRCTRRRFAIRWDTAFAEVVEGCADPRRPHGWITAEIRDAYVELHRLGWAHSVEAWDDDGLAGGLYGVGIGRLFAAESMFHRRTDAGKAALASLCERLGSGALLDVQWLTPHLASLGAIEVPREEYLARLARAVSSA